MKAIVVGGGIGGLAAAVALTRRGWQVEVLERAAEFTEIGAGLAVQPNALRALDAIGLGGPVRERAQADPPAGIRQADGDWLVRNDTGGLKARYGSWGMLPRAELLEILRDALPAEALRPGIEVHDVRSSGTVAHSGGVSTGDLVVGADGVNSLTRRALWPDAPGPRYAGYTTWRMITPPRPVDGTVETWGRGLRFGYSPLPDGRVYCYAMVNAPEGAPGDLAGLRRRFATWHDPIPALVSRADEDTALSHDTYELPDLDTFVSGKVALLGDAAHAMTPNLGQGACQALEDAAVLAATWDAGGLAAYDRARRPRTQMIARRSRKIGDMAQRSAAPITTARNAAMRMTPRAAYARSLAPVVGWTI